MIKRQKIKKGDTDEVLAGKERGKKGKVLSVDLKHERILVEKLNFQKRHLRPGHPLAQQGGIVEREGSITFSNIILICPKCQKRTRPRFKILESGSRVRICRKCDEHVD